MERQTEASSIVMERTAAAGEKLKSAGDKISAVTKKFLPVTGVVAGFGAGNCLVTNGSFFVEPRKGKIAAKTAEF